MLDLFQEIYATIIRNKLRTILTGFAVTWGIFMLIVLLGAGNGLLHAFEGQNQNIKMNSIKIFPGFTNIPFHGWQQGRKITLKEQDRLFTQQTFHENVISTGANISHTSTLSFKKETQSIELQGVFPNYTELENIQMKQSLQMQKKRQTDIKSIKTLLDSAGKIAVKGDMNAEENINGCIIPNEIFANQTALETVILPKNTAIIAADAFSGCKNLKTVKMPEGLLSVKARAFQGCTSLERVVFPTLLEIEWDVFNGCNLLSDVLFPEGLLRMDFSIFQGTQVTHVDIPSTVRKIGGLFGIEDNVKEVHCKATVPPELKRKYVENSDKQYRIYIPAGSSTAYNKAWGNLNFVEE